MCKCNCVCVSGIAAENVPHTHAGVISVGVHLYTSTCTVCTFFSLLFFCCPLISSSPFPLPSSFLIFFSHSFFLFYFLFPFFLPLSVAFLSLFPPFILFSWLLPPFPLLSLSHCFCFCFFSFSPLNFFLVSTLCQGGCYEHKG